MRIAVWSEYLPLLGGAEKHGLGLLEPLAGIHDVTVYYRNVKDFHPSLIEERFGFSLPGVDYICCGSAWSVSKISASYDLFINITDASLVINKARRGILMVYCPLPLDDVGAFDLRRRVDHWMGRRRQGLLGWLAGIDEDLVSLGYGDYAARRGRLAAAAKLPHFLLRKLAWGRESELRLGRAAIGSYDMILAISEFSRVWVGEYYGRSAQVSYPSIDVARFVPGEKEKVILNVGRFDPGGKPKRQDVLIAAFKGLCDRGVLDGWRLCICGYSDLDESSRAYIEKLKDDALGYPVSFSVDVGHEAVAELYATSSVYWHAMGYGEDVGKSPWRLEHFGMTTVEAMAAGCIPMTFAAGGQPEIVTHREDGYLWRTIEDLELSMEDYLGLMNDRLSSMRQAAQDRARKFSRRSFLENTVDIYRYIGITCREGLLEDRPHRVVGRAAEGV